MNLDNLETLEQIEEFLSGTQAVAFGIASTKQERWGVPNSVGCGYENHPKLDLSVASTAKKASAEVPEISVATQPPHFLVLPI